MKQTKRSGTAVDTLHSDCFLLVASSGNIEAGTAVREDLDGHETWQSHCANDHFRLQRLYPTQLSAVDLPIDRVVRKSIEATITRALAGILDRAQREAGRALLCYALRFGRVDSIDLRIRIFPDGNLYVHVKNRTVDRILTAGTHTVIYSSAPGDRDASFVNHLQNACVGLGWTAQRHRDAPNTGYDLSSFYDALTSIPELTDVSGSAPNPSIPGLMGELLNLATEIFTDSTVTRGYEALVKALVDNQRLWLSQEEIESVVAPATVPDYSERIAEIAVKNQSSRE